MTSGTFIMTCRKQK